MTENKRERVVTVRALGWGEEHLDGQFGLRIHDRVDLEPPDVFLVGVVPAPVSVGVLEGRFEEGGVHGPLVADDARPSDLLDENPVDRVQHPVVQQRQEPGEGGLVRRPVFEATLPRPEVVLGEEVGEVSVGPQTSEVQDEDRGQHGGPGVSRSPPSLSWKEVFQLRQVCLVEHVCQRRNSHPFRHS